MQVSEIILDILAAHGVRQIFGVPGDAINDITNALRKRDDMEFILVKHEEAGAFMASAQAKLTGNLTACVGTAGPGAVHLLNGLYDAKLDHAPVIALTGQAPTRFIGTGYHQEVDTERLFADVAEYSRTVMAEEQIPSLVLEACKAALAAPGVAHLSIPEDISGRRVKSARADFQLGSAKGETRPCKASLKKASGLIDGVEKVTLMAGIGAAHARQELLDLSRHLQAPVVRTLRAKDFIDEGDECCVGGLGLLGSAAGQAAIDGCDLLLICGANFPYVDFYPDKAKIIQIDPNPRRMGRRAPLDASLQGHARATLRELLEAVGEKQSAGFYNEMQREKRKEQAGYQADRQSDSVPIKPQRVMADLAAVAPADAVFLCDTGTTTAWAARHLPVGKGQRFTLSSSLASMAFAMPAAIGAQFAFPGRPVIAICGDGGFTMLMADFITAVKYDLPITCVIFNNGKLGFIGLEQEARGIPQHDIELLNPDFVRFANACGGVGFRVDGPDQLQHALTEAIASPRPALVDVAVDPDELVEPPHITARQAFNFGVAKVKETAGRILSERANRS